MSSDLHLWENPKGFPGSRLSRRRILQLLGCSLAGAASADILAACGSTSPPVRVTPTPNAAVTVRLESTRQLTPYFLGYNDEAMHTPSWSNTTFAQAAAQLKPGTLRYPGGTIANYWDWQKGWFFPNLAARPGFENLTPNIYRLRELQQGLQATGAQPIYVLNLLTSDLNYQLAMLRAAKSMGLPVTFVELGNEFYIDENDNVAKFTTGQDYGQVAAGWISAIRREFPDAQIAAVGGLPGGGQANDHGRRKSWTRDVLQTLQGADALTLHPYVDIRPNIVSKDTPSTGAGAIAAAEKIVTALAPTWKQVQATLSAMPPGMEMWFTEYNLTDLVGNIQFRWIQGIFVASMAFTFLTEMRSALSCVYDLICGGGFESMVCDSSHGTQGSGLIPFALTAVGWSMKFMNDVMSGMNSAQQMSFDPDLPVNGDSPSVSSLLGWVFTDGKRQQGLVLNRSANTFVWRGDAVFSQGSRFKQLYSDPFKIITGPDTLTMTGGKLQGQLVLPAYSLTQLRSGNA